MPGVECPPVDLRFYIHSTDLLYGTNGVYTSHTPVRLDCTTHIYVSFILLFLKCTGVMYAFPYTAFGTSCLQYIYIYSVSRFCNLDENHSVATQTLTKPTSQAPYPGWGYQVTAAITVQARTTTTTSTTATTTTCFD